MTAIVGDKEAGKKGLVLKSCYTFIDVQYSYGVSVYFPWSEQPADMRRYNKLYFAREAGWADFASWFFL